MHGSAIDSKLYLQDLPGGAGVLNQQAWRLTHKSFLQSGVIFPLLSRLIITVELGHRPHPLLVSIFADFGIRNSTYQTICHSKSYVASYIIFAALDCYQAQGIDLHSSASC